jgi:adenylylsulfate kinase
MNNLTYHPNRVSKTDKNEKFKHSSPVVWLTGLSGSGKSTVGNALEQALFERGIKTQVLDGDNIRMGLNKDLGFSDDDRKENMRRISEVAKLFSDSGTLTITAFISPFREEREKCKEIIGKDNFVEIFIDAELNVCEARDPKGLYKKARAGEIPNFTGIDSPYEKPIDPDLTVSTGHYSIAECVDQIIDYLEEKSVIQYTPKEIPNLDKKNTLAIDFDGVIHKYSKGFQGLDNAYDPPNEGTKEALEELINQGYRLKILSSRPKEVIFPWLEKYGMDHLIDDVSNHKFPATVYIDDRGFHFQNWEQTLETLNNHPKTQKKEYVE